MDFRDFEFSKQELERLQQMLPPSILQELGDYGEVVLENLKYLRDYGFQNYKELFLCYPEYFLSDTVTFQNRIGKYKKDALIDLLLRKPSLFEDL